MKKYPMSAEAITANIQAETINAIKNLASAHRERAERLYRQAEDIYNEGEESTPTTEALFDKSEIAHGVADALDDLAVFLRTFRN